MKKIVLGLLLVAGLGTSAMAQGEKKDKGTLNKMSVEQRAEKQTERMSKSLELSADQKQALYKANLESAQAFKKDRKEQRAKMKALAQAREEKLKSILAPDQYQKHVAQKAERKKKMQERKAAGKGRMHKGDLRKQNASPQGLQMDSDK
jgi:Spy/CpxP family protein refolding chaperone